MSVYETRLTDDETAAIVKRCEERAGIDEWAEYFKALDDPDVRTRAAELAVELRPEHPFDTYGAAAYLPDDTGYDRFRTLVTGVSISALRMPFGLLEPAERLAVFLYVFGIADRVDEFARGQLSDAKSFTAYMRLLH